LYHYSTIIINLFFSKCTKIHEKKDLDWGNRQILKLIPAPIAWIYPIQPRVVNLTGMMRLILCKSWTFYSNQRGTILPREGDFANPSHGLKLKEINCS
jgi:hypothetical protein